MQTSDRDHIQRCLGGDHDEYRFLVARYEGAVFAFATTRVADRALAREVAEEAFVRAFFALSKLKKPESFHSWLLGITGRVALEFARRRMRAEANAATLESAGADDPEDAHAGRLDEAIAALPEAQRQVILLRYFDRLSCREIAGKLGLPIGSVTKTLSRAYEALRAHLETPLQPATSDLLEDKS